MHEMRVMTHRMREMRRSCPIRTAGVGRSNVGFVGYSLPSRTLRWRTCSHAVHDPRSHVRVVLAASMCASSATCGDVLRVIPRPRCDAGGDVPLSRSTHVVRDVRPQVRIRPERTRTVPRVCVHVHVGMCEVGGGGVPVVACGRAVCHGCGVPGLVVVPPLVCPRAPRLCVRFVKCCACWKCGVSLDHGP